MPYQGPERRRSDCDRRTDGTCPMNESQANELLDSHKQFVGLVYKLDKQLELLNQSSIAKDADHEKRLKAIEDSQAYIIKNMQEYKKYLFAGSVVLSVLASIGAAIWALWDSRGDIADAIRNFIGIRPDESKK